MDVFLKNVDDEEKMKILNPAYNKGGVLQANTEYWFLTEDGLYEVLMQSRKPKAKEFKKEVKKILKSIRKTGGYVVGEENGDMIPKLLKSVSDKLYTRKC